LKDNSRLGPAAQHVGSKTGKIKVSLGQRRNTLVAKNMKNENVLGQRSNMLVAKQES